MGLPVEVAREGCVGSHGAGITSSCHLSTWILGIKFGSSGRAAKSVIELPSIEPLPLPSPPLNAGSLDLDSCFFVSSIVSMMTGILNGFNICNFLQFLLCHKLFYTRQSFP